MAIIIGKSEHAPIATTLVPIFLALLSPAVLLPHGLQIKQLFAPVVLVLPQAHIGQVGVTSHELHTLHPLASS